MTWSANEIANLAAKAARGGGAPPAQAAVFGRAALRHLIAGRDIGGLQDAVLALPAGPILALPQAFAEVCESAQNGRAKADLPVGELTHSYAEAMPYFCEAITNADHVTINVELTRPAQNQPVRRVDLPLDFAAHLKRLADKLLVPESDASRLSGAGAGLSDND
jgi:hypothetical protein